MQQLNNLHRAIVTANAVVAAEDIRPHPRLSPAEQIGIYINNYRQALTGAVVGDFPCLNDYLGPAAMRTLVEAYIDTVPPRSYNLDFYAFSFAGFIRAQVAPPAAALADLESTIAEIFMSPGSPALTIDTLTQNGANTLGNKIFRPRPATRLLCLSHDAETYWHNHKQGQKLPEIAPTQVYLCICRHRHDVLRHRLEPGAFAILRELFSGKNFNEAVAIVLEQNHLTESELAQHIGTWLPQWIEAGFFGA